MKKIIFKTLKDKMENYFKNIFEKLFFCSNLSGTRIKHSVYMYISTALWYFCILFWGGDTKKYNYQNSWPIKSVLKYIFQYSFVQVINHVIYDQKSYLHYFSVGLTFLFFKYHCLHLHRRSHRGKLFNQPSFDTADHIFMCHNH